MTPQAVDDWVSVLTPPGRGAVAVVAAGGPAALRAADAHLRAASGNPLSQQAVDRIAFGLWGAGAQREEVIALRSAPAAVEIHCHGGAAAAERILASFRQAGCQIQPWTEWLSRQHRCDIPREADAALAHATTRRTAAILLDQRQGALQRALDAVDAAIACGDSATAERLIGELVARARVGRRLVEPWRVALAGRPNVGKSSLINALAGYERAIVLDRPGTTRDVLTVEAAIEGWPVRLIDAAGLRETADPLESEGVARAQQQLAQADLVLWVIDATAVTSTDWDCMAATPRLSSDELFVASVIRVVNKIDLAPDAAGAGDLAVSALTGDGLGGLLRLIAARLVPEPPRPGDAVPFTTRHIELLRDRAERLSPS